VDLEVTRANNPVAQQRLLRSELRAARERAGLTQREVALSLDWSTSKVIRIEAGASNVSTTDLQAMLKHYGVADDRIGQLVEVAKASRQRAWWDEYRGSLDQDFVTLLELEASTSLIRQFQSLLIPGLLQTEPYAREILKLYAKPDELDYKVKIRMERQQILDGEDAVKAFFIIDEAAVRRWVGGPGVVREQLEKLKELNRMPNISIQILTFDKGVHRGMRGHFEVFEFPTDEQDDVVYLEWSGGAQILQNNAAQVSNYVEIFLELETVASPPDKLDAVIDRLIEEVAPN